VVPIVDHLQSSNQAIKVEDEDASAGNGEEMQLNVCNNDSAEN